MDPHETKVNKITHQLKTRVSTSPLSLKKRSVSHQVPKSWDRNPLNEKLDISDLDEILEVNPELGLCIAEPGATFERVVSATLPYGLVPVVVPELKTITIGGAVAGCSIESMSFKYGGFHDSCLEYEVVTAKGDVLVCTPDNEHQLLFQMLHGTFGTLGIITRITFRLIPAKPFVKMTYERYSTLEAYKDAIWRHYLSQDIDFMDGIIHNPNLYVLSLGHFVDQAPYTHHYDWARIYYLSTATRKEDYLKTPDYFFRYDKGVTNVHPKPLIGRLLFGKLFNSTNTLKLAHRFKSLIPSKQFPITIDTFIPFSRMEAFMDWYVAEIVHFPLWCVPYKVVRHYEWLSEDYLQTVKDELFLDIALYGMQRDNPMLYYRRLEEKLMELGAIKTLISTNLYTEAEFWSVWNRTNYNQVKRLTDPDNIFRDLYEKTCPLTANSKMPIDPF